MPQLDKDKAKEVADAESSFGPLDEGIYLAKLIDVTAQDGAKGEYWVWEFGDLINVDTEKEASGRQWLNTSLSEASAWKLQETFEAFGAAPDTDTDTLLGRSVWIVVSQRTIEKGARMGTIGNQVERVLSVGDGDEAVAAAQS